MLKLKHIPVKSFGENIAYIYKDCALYKVDDLNKVTKLEIHKGNKTIYAFLQIVAEEGVLAADEIGLNDEPKFMSAWRHRQPVRKLCAEKFPVKF